MTRIYFFKSNGLTKKDQVKMTKVGTNMLSDTAKRRQKDGNETATSDKVIIRTPLGHFLRYVAMIFAVLVMSIANVGVAWGAVYKTYALSDLTYTSATLTYEVTGLSSNDQKLNKGERKVEVPCASASGTLYLSGTGANADRYASIWGSNGTAVDASRKIAMTSGYGSGISFTSADILTEGGKYYIIFSNVDGSDYKINAFKYVLSSACGGSTKRIYMKCGSTWCNDNPKFYAHSWGSSDSDVELTLADCETDVYYADIPSGNTSVVFTRQSPSSTGIAWSGSNFWNQSEDITISTNNKFTCTGWNNSKGTFSGGTYSAPTYTVTYNKNGDGAGGAGSVTGSVPTDSNSPYACGSTVTVLGNTGSLALDGYTFAGWNTAPGGGGTSYAANATFTISANTTLYAQWEENASYSVTYNANGATGSVPTDANTYANGATVTVLGKNTLAKTNYGFAGWRTAVSSGTWYVQGQTFAMGSANVNLYAQWIAEASLVSGTKYQAADLKAAALTSTSSESDRYRAGISTNGVSEILGTGVANGTAGPMEYNTISSTTVDDEAFTSALYFKGTGSGNPSGTGTTIPTSRAIKFRVPASGVLHLYVKGAGAISLIKSGGTAVVIGDGTDNRHVTANVTAGTYYLFATNSSRTLYGLKFVQSCTAPTGLTAASTTAKGTTFTITDGANTNDYEFYVVTSSGTPASNVTPTHTTTNKTLTITDCMSGTTYYAWVRSKCSESNKSAWTALTGSTFTTSTVTVTHTLTNVTKTSGATTAGGSDYTAVFAAVSGYSLPAPAITIDGNAAESGTDYTWTQGTGTVVIPANKITGDIVITIASAAAAPTNVAISGTYHYYPGETIELTATPTGGNGPKTYQWYHGGTADDNAIDGATSATFTKSNCVVGDAGSYYCKVTCGGSASTWSDGAGHDPYNVKIMQFVLKNNSSVEISRTALTKVDATHATVILHLTGGTTYKFRITDGCGNYFGNTGTMTNGNSTDWYMNADADCGMTTGLKTSNYTFNVTLGDLGNGMQVTAIYPGGDQAAGKIIYWDNSVLNWDAGDQWYRIGKSTHHNKTQMTLVPGTANLYKVTTAEYNGFEYWHIANNQGNGDGNLFWTKGDAAKAITNAMEFEGAPVTLDAITVTPTNSHETGETSDNDNCEFYTHTTVSGMKTQSVSITAPSNGTLTVNYVDVNNVGQAFSSGSQNLAHTCIITVTAVPNMGYAEPAQVSINGSPYGNRDPYTVTGTTVVAATFSLIDYTVTLHTNGGTINAGNVTSYNYGTGATLPTNVTKDGYTFDGWFDNAGLTGSAVTTISSSATGNKEFWAKWTCVTPTFETNLSTTEVNYNVGDAASALTVAATAGGGTVTYQWYKNTANSTTTPTPTALTTGASYTPSTAATGTTYYFCVATNSTAGCSTTATSNITPVTVAATYTVTYQYNGATSGASPASATGASVTLPTPTRTGYVLDGWYKTDGTKVGDGGDTYNPTADVTLYARWETACAGGGGSTTLVDINFTNKGNSTSYSAGNTYTLDGTSVYFKSAMSTYSDGTYLNLPGNASTSSNYIAVPLADINGEITITVTHNNTRPQWKHNFTGLNAPATSSNLSTNPSSMSDNTRPGSNTTTSTWTISTNKSYGVFYIGKGSNGTNQFMGLTITTPGGGGSGTCYSVKYCGNGATSGYVSDPTSYAANDDPVVLDNVGLYPFVRAGYTFTGWNTEAGGGGTAYAVGATITDISADVTLYAQWTPTVNYSVTHTLTNVTATSGATGASAATGYTAYNATFEAAAGYNLPSTITVTIGGETATETTDYTWNSSTGALEILAASVTGNIVVTIAGEVAPTTKDIYYGHVKITDGALVREIPSGATQFFTNIGGTVANNTEISLSSTPSTGGIYYNSNNLTDTELSKSSNWGSSSGSNRYIRGLKFANGTTYTLALGTKVASAITFYGWCGSASKTMTVGGEEYVSSSTKNKFAKHVFTKSGDFTGNVTITQDGDFYGILVITIQTAAPCTTPVIPSLSDQTVCPGSDIAAWDATQTAVLADGETASYSWKKKGNDTELAPTASFDLGSSATESQAGTYVVTVTVSKVGKASASASAEVDLTVTPATEEPSVSQSPATVYVSNSVTLTATCGSAGTLTWSWHTCNSDGSGESSAISGATTNTYALTAPASAGTYYYKVKVTGDGTNACGTASHVYALTVAAASECENYYWFIYADDATANGVINNRDGFFSNTTTGTGNTGTYTMTVDGVSMTGTKRLSTAAYAPKFTVPAGATATLYIYGKAASSDAGKHLVLKRTSDDEEVEVTSNTTVQGYTKEDIEPGEWTLSCGSSNWCYSFFAVKVCSTSSCTDATPTIAAVNNTVCSGTKMRIDATGYETGATFKWQKLNTSTSSWDDVAGATLDSLVIASVTASNAGSYRFIATKGCARTSNTVTIAVPSAPVFGDVPSSVSVMQTLALSISTVEATDAVKYRWYKSADDTWDAGDVEIGTDKTLIKAYAGEATGSPSYYVFCRAQNACGITTSSAIAVNVTTYVEEDCATKGNEGEAQFEFENTSCSQGTYSSESAWYTNSRTKYLTYTAPEGKYFDEAKVRIAVSSGSKCGYAYSTDGGTTWTYAEKTGLSSDLADITIDLTGNVNAFRIGRNLQDGSSKDWGVTSGNFYLTKACFTYINACTSTTVTPSSSSVNYEIGGVWSSPTFTLSPAVGTLTYSSSDEDIASVDDEGAVTFNGDAGTVTITASYAGDGTYCASEGIYTITVSCPGGAPKVVPDGTVNMSGCNSSVILHAKQQDGTSDFADGTYQWFRDGEEISGATSASYTAVQAGIYTVERTNAGGCTTPSTNSAVVTSETTEPEVERLVPFQYYHVNKTYSDQMKMRHLFAVKNSGKLDGKSFKMYVSRNGGDPTDVTNSNALAIWTNADGRVDTVMIDLNKLSGKYSVNDELVYTCKAIDCEGNVSDVYMNTITMHVIGATPTLALICSGSNKEGGTRKTGELTVGGDFLTGYNKADLCEQTGNTSFNADVEWGLYTRLKANYIVTPVNGYAVFNKLNYEPFDILLLTDYPKASKSDAAATVLDDMAELCDYRPLLSFKAHMVHKTPSKWAAKGFTTEPVAVKQGDGRIYMNIVCYAHPMFDGIKEAGDHIFRDHDENSQIVYEVLTGPGHENSKGIQGFEIDAAENFVTIGLIHYNASAAENIPSTGELSWTPALKDGKSLDRMLVAAVERQTNPEARLIVLAVNCGAQSKFTETGRTIVHKCLEYLLSDATDPITPVADCSFTFDNGAGALHEAEWYQDPAHCPGCTGTLGDGLWSTEANWGPDRVSIPGEFTSVRIAAPVTVDMEHAHAMEARIVEGGSIEIPAGKALEVKSTIRRFDGSEISPTEVSDIFIGSTAAGNGTLIFNNDKGDSKATVAMYTTALADVANMSAATSTWQYIGTPHNDVAVARYNYYNSWLYQYDTGTEGWTVIPNGGPLVPFRGYCVTHPEANHTFVMDGKLTATTNADIAIPANKYVVVANSWVAPIDITAITDDDMENITDKTIYFFNTGSDSDGNGTAGTTETAPGTYVTVPKNSASYVGNWQIPSMQGFYVVGGSSDGTLHLDYSRHVRPSDARSVVGNPMYAPRRSAESNEPEVAKLYFRGHRYYDRLIVLEREDFTRGYDSGWDGEAWGGNDAAPMSYVSTEGRWDAVSAVPEYEGTVIGFRAGEDNEYTIDFEYSPESEPLYLLDTENNTYTQVIVGNAYHFTTGDKASHERFVLTRKSPSVTTEIDNVQRDNVPSTKARKILIEDKLFIMINGLLYDATGKVVK